MSDPADILSELLRAVNKELMNMVTECLHHYGMGPQDIIVTMFVSHNPGTTVSEIARKTRMAKSHVSRTVDRLAELGFVKKRPDEEDRRLVRLYTTDNTKAHVEAVNAKVREFITGALDNLPEDTVRSLVEGLALLKDALEKQRVLATKSLSSAQDGPPGMTSDSR